ncbi:hypothetical protein Q3G72_000763 [Acer saccharum]|nr:hypothetical protein Q3G72_000763 [Acer saccharum]
MSFRVRARAKTEIDVSPLEIGEIKKEEEIGAKEEKESLVQARDRSHGLISFKKEATTGPSEQPQQGQEPTTETRDQPAQMFQRFLLQKRTATAKTTRTRGKRTTAEQTHKQKKEEERKTTDSPHPKQRQNQAPKTTHSPFHSNLSTPPLELCLASLSVVSLVSL